MKLRNPRIIIIAYIAIVLIICFIAIKIPKIGYYSYNDDYYYYQNGSWYIYDDYGDYGSWRYITVPETLKDDCSDYYSSQRYMYSYGIDNFENSAYYEKSTSSSSSSSSWDDDSDYDLDSSSSWDSDYTDWDCDWQKILL